jgi:hypothetical protein
MSANSQLMNDPPKLAPNPVIFADALPLHGDTLLACRQFWFSVCSYSNPLVLGPRLSRWSSLL